MDPPVPPPVDPRGALQAWASQWLTPEKPPEGWKGIPARVIAFVRRIPPGAWLATVAFLLMAITAVVAWRSFRTGSVHLPWEYRLDWRWFATIGLLVLTVPALLYRSVTAWSSRPVSPFATIDEEWDRGLHALMREGVSLASTPVFLVLGVGDKRRERGLIEASGLDLRSFDDGNDSIAWHVGKQAVYLSLRGVGLTSVVERIGAAGSSASRLEFGDDEPATDSAADLRLTKSRHDALTHVARRLREARATTCACNGILAVLSFDELRTTSPEDDRLAHALRSDLLTIQRTTGVRAPVTLLVDGAERHPGFAELVRRLGHDRATSQRFGHRYEPSTEAVAEDVGRLAEHACGAFEDWMHVLFKEQRVLGRKGNLRLYSLLSHVRLRLTGRLRRLLREGIGYDPEYESPEEGVPFSGCYFCGLDPEGDQLAFAPSVFRKQLAEQSLVEWTGEQERRSRRRRSAWWIAASLDIVLIGTLIAMLVLRPV